MTFPRVDREPGPCWWCSRPGEPSHIYSRGANVFSNPVLCTVCIGLLEMGGGGGFASADDARYKAVEDVERELARRSEASPATITEQVMHGFRDV
jgi:hypothetical protein